MDDPSPPAWPRRIDRLVDTFIEGLPCRHPDPYPELRTFQPNREHAVLLLDAYADGAAAELTAITQYMYHHFTIADPAIRDLELCIALVEMKHLELLAELISGLGVEPRFWRANMGYWNGSNVMYGADPCQQLRMDIEAEEAAIAGYNRLICEMEDPEVIKVLERILLDEKVHLQLFHEALLRCCHGC